MRPYSYNTILVTGAAGFVGSATCKLLCEQGTNVIGIDNLNDYYAIEIKKYRLKQLEQYSSFTFIQGDVEDLSFIDGLFAKYKPEAVINLAARAGVRASLENPYIYITTNTTGSLNILECMHKYGVKKIVLASTSSLYAGQPMPFTEDAPVNNPISPYACSKKAAELLCYNYHYHYSFDVSIVRYFTVYGPAGRPDMGYLRFIKWISEKKPLKVFGDGKQARDFTYIDDIANGTVLALKNIGYEIINLGGGKNPVSMLDIISTLENMLHQKALIQFEPTNKSDMDATSANIEKAKKLLGWEAKIDIQEGLQKTVDWYKTNEPWLSNITF
jgi:nucleoside-diphosphate-sugar epimerase